MKAFAGLASAVLSYVYSLLSFFYTHAKNKLFMVLRYAFMVDDAFMVYGPFIASPLVSMTMI